MKVNGTAVNRHKTYYAFLRSKLSNNSLFQYEMILNGGRVSNTK